MPVLEEGKLLLGKNLPTKNQLTVQMTWQEGKSEGFREILRYDKRNRNAICGLWTSIKCVEMLSKTSTLKNVHRIRWGIFKIYE